MSAATAFRFLAPNPKSSYKQLFVKGTRIRARILYGRYMSREEPRTPQQIAEDYAVPVEAVNEAIAYCESNPAELLEDYRCEQALMEASGMNDPDYRFHPSPTLLTAQEIARIERGS